MNYRPATAQDVGRDDVEFSDQKQQWTIGKLTAIEGVFPLAEPVHRANGSYGYRYARVPILPEEEAMNSDFSDLLSDGPVIHTIRRKLEAGGYAEPEKAVLIDGKLYPLDWIKSGVGVLPEQCAII